MGGIVGQSFKRNEFQAHACVPNEITVPDAAQPILPPLVNFPVFLAEIAKCGIIVLPSPLSSVSRAKRLLLEGSLSKRWVFALISQPSFLEERRLHSLSASHSLQASRVPCGTDIFFTAAWHLLRAIAICQDISAPKNQPAMTRIRDFILLACALCAAWEAEASEGDEAFERRSIPRLADQIHYHDLVHSHAHSHAPAVAHAGHSCGHSGIEHLQEASARAFADFLQSEQGQQALKQGRHLHQAASSATIRIAVEFQSVQAAVQQVVTTAVNVIQKFVKVRCLTSCASHACHSHAAQSLQVLKPSPSSHVM